MPSTLLRVKNHLSDSEFFELCQINDLRMERDKYGTILMMEPNGSETGNFNLEVGSEIRNWNKDTHHGKAFASSAGFMMPDTSIRSPDVSWIAKARWEKIATDLRKKFAPIAPDFVVEIRSESDSLNELQEKMRDYISNGVRLGWLIDRKEAVTYIYRLDGSLDTVAFNETLSGEEVLVGFRLRILDLDLD
ncbi:MAG: hypothetical protein RLZZ292_225 [Bacteroidota bacterium]